MNSSPNDQAHVEPAADGARKSAERRRRLMLGGVSAPLLMTIASRPAWANGETCTPSALASANLSGQHTQEGCSKSAGFWKQKPGQWPAGPDVYFNPASTFGSVFGNVNIPTGEVKDGVPETVNFGSLTLLEVMNLKGKDDPYQVGFHTVGALVNAYAFPTHHATNPGYVYSPDQVISSFKSIASGVHPSMVAHALETANNLYDNDWNP